jgi:hypothetical protein
MGDERVAELETELMDLYETLDERDAKIQELEVSEERERNARLVFKSIKK